jgi:hypothetical protein
MKKIITIFLIILTIKSAIAQNNDAGRIVLNSVVLDNDGKMPNEAKSQLQTKLTQIASNNGMGGNSINPKFVVAGKINILSKYILAGPPQMVALNCEIVFFIGDAEANQVFSTITVTGKGIGTNENKALISLIQNINLNNKQFSDLVTVGKAKIVEFYDSKCDFILKKAQTKSEQTKFDEAIYDLVQVPEVCKICYIKCLSEVKNVYKKKIDIEGALKLNDAKNKWYARQDRIGADEVAPILSSIEPESNSYKEASALSEIIRIKIQSIENRDWEFKMKKYKDDLNAESKRIESFRQIAITYFQNQPRTIIYNHIIW